MGEGRVVVFLAPEGRTGRVFFLRLDRKDAPPVELDRTVPLVDQPRMEIYALVARDADVGVLTLDVDEDRRSDPEQPAPIQRLRVDLASGKSAPLAPSFRGSLALSPSGRWAVGETGVLDLDANPPRLQAGIAGAGVDVQFLSANVFAFPRGARPESDWREVHDLESGKTYPYVDWLAAHPNR